MTGLFGLLLWRLLSRKSMAPGGYTYIHVDRSPMKSDPTTFSHQIPSLLPKVNTPWRIERKQKKKKKQLTAGGEQRTKEKCRFLTTCPLHIFHHP